MKKTLLLAFISSPLLLLAQQTKELKTPQHNQATSYVPEVVVDNGNSDGKPAATYTNEQVRNKKDQPYSFVQIGETTYDLQTNASVGNRIILHSNGSISAVWTTTQDLSTTTFPNRGTGYNFYNGTNWGNVVKSRLESNTRTGWPSIGVLDDGSEYVIAHESNTGGFGFSTNGSLGSTSWSTDAPVLDDESVPGDNRVPIWGRSASNGDIIHVICNYWNSDQAADVKINGVDYPTIYSRSLDGGDTWIDESILLPGYDDSKFTSGGGDRYALTVRDSVVAIVIGGYGEALFLWKSTNNGDDWTVTSVDNFTYPGFQQHQWFNDTLDGNDGSIDVMIDNDNKAHVFYGGMEYTRRIDAGTGDTAIFNFFGTARLMYWNEDMSEPKIIATGIDRDNNNAYDITAETTASLEANGNIPVDTRNLLTTARYGITGVITHPSAAIDASGNIYCVYSAPVEYAVSFLNANFRDIHVVYSDNDGSTWSDPQNITQDDGNEHVFACAAKTANDYLHLIWQKDDIPGTNLQNNSSGASNHLITNNQILYGAIPVSAIQDGSIGQHTLSAPSVKKAEVFVVSQNWPNPVNNLTNVTIYLNEGSELSLSVTDILGNVVSEGSIGYKNAGNHAVEIDANGLNSGIYFYTISSKDHSITKKMQVN